MEDRKPDEGTFPYAQLFGVVAVSVLVTLGIFWVWHRVEISQLAEAHERENDKIHEEITILSDHLSSIGGTSTASMTQMKAP